MNKLLQIFFFVLTSFGYSQSKIANYKISHFEDVDKKYNLEQVIDRNYFKKNNKNKTLNFGITKSNHWLKIELNNLELQKEYILKILTITPDSIEIFDFDKKGIKKSFIGECFYSNEHFLHYNFKSENPSKTIILKLFGNGQPVSLPIVIEEQHNLMSQLFAKIMAYGIVYGIIFFIILLNLIMFITTKQKIYFYSFCYILSATGTIIYFDGFIKLFVFPDSGYLNNLSVIFFLSASFIATNLYVNAFLDPNKICKKLGATYIIFNWLFFINFFVAFFQPYGFAIAVKFNLIMCTAEAVLFFYSIYVVKKHSKKFHKTQLIGFLMLIFCGTFCQLYFLGILPLNYFTRHAVHLMVLPQIALQTIAIALRFNKENKRNVILQGSIVRNSEKYAQSLISNLENERKRLASEFHDSIGQNILVIRNQVLLLQKQDNNQSQSSKLNEIEKITSETLSEIRQIAQNLRPSTLQTLGLAATLELMIERLKSANDLSINYLFDKKIDTIQLPDFDIYIYRIIQELFNNVLKHANAKNVFLETSIYNNQININFIDDGIGMNKNANDLKQGNGIFGIKERLKIMKGNINFSQKNNSGTFIIIKIPIKPTN